MAIQVKTEVIDVKIENYDSLDSSKCTLFDIEKDLNTPNDKESKTQFLKFYTSIVGEDSPLKSELSSNYISDTSKSYRYDWAFGLSCLPKHNKKDFSWDWKAKLREFNSIKIQLLFEPKSGSSDVFFNIIHANLLCLIPSKDTSSSWSKKKEGISNTLNSIANITKDYSKIASDVFNVANTLTNFIAPDDNGQNWYLYKFLDQDSGCFSLEWHINKRVIDQFGPMLHGSLVLDFHSNTNTEQKIKFRVRPSLSFIKDYDLCYVSPYDSLNINHFLEICPK